MNRFEISAVNYLDHEGLIVEIYFDSNQWAEIFFENQEVKVKFYSHPQNGYWEFSYSEALLTIEKAKNRLQASMKKSKRDDCINSLKIADINAQAQKKLEEILKHPEKTIVHAFHHELGKIVKIQVSGKGGAWFTADGKMIGFLEP